MINKDSIRSRHVFYASDEKEGSAGAGPFSDHAAEDGEVKTTDAADPAGQSGKTAAGSGASASEGSHHHHHRHHKTRLEDKKPEELDVVETAILWLKQSRLRQKTIAFILWSLFCTVLSVALQLTAIKYAYDSDAYVYKEGAVSVPLVWGFQILATVFIVILASLIANKEKDKVFTMRLCGIPQTLFGSAAGFAVPACSFMTMLNYRKTGGLQYKLSVVSLFLSVIVFAYLIGSVLTKHHNSKKLKALGFFPVLWIISVLINVYFDRTTPINDPMKLLLQMALIALMLYFLMELRIRVGKSGLIPFLIFSSISFMLCASYAFPVFFAPQMEIRLGGRDVYLAATLLLLSVYAFSRLHLFTKKRKK